MTGSDRNVSEKGLTRGGDARNSCVMQPSVAEAELRSKFSIALALVDAACVFHVSVQLKREKNMSSEQCFICEETLSHGDVRYCQRERN